MANDSTPRLLTPFLFLSDKNSGRPCFDTLEGIRDQPEEEIRAAQGADNAKEMVEASLLTPQPWHLGSGSHNDVLGTPGNANLLPTKS